MCFLQNKIKEKTAKIRDISHTMSCYSSSHVSARFCSGWCMSSKGGGWHIDVVGSLGSSGEAALWCSKSSSEPVWEGEGREESIAESQSAPAKFTINIFKFNQIVVFSWITYVQKSQKNSNFFSYFKRVNQRRDSQTPRYFQNWYRPSRTIPLGYTKSPAKHISDSAKFPVNGLYFRGPLFQNKQPGLQPGQSSLSALSLSVRFRSLLIFFRFDVIDEEEEAASAIKHTSQLLLLQNSSQTSLQLTITNKHP